MQKPVAPSDFVSPPPVTAAELPAVIANWFAARNWQIRSHQHQILLASAKATAMLLIAPTGGGKTLGGFLPSLCDLAAAPGTQTPGLHTLYVSPLKALAVDIRRNLQAPIEEMGLPIRIEARTGDTPADRRRRQHHNPPDILLTTPEQLALMLAHKDAPRYFQHLQFLVLDELHALADNKRGDLLALHMARLCALAPDHKRIGLSATVAAPADLARYLGCGAAVEQIIGAAGPKPEVGILTAGDRIPWSGHLARHIMPEIYQAIRQHRTSLIFVNTRSQAEIAFQALWRLNEDNLAIALHHGSLSPQQRRKVEAAMVREELHAVVCTSTLDLGIDWGGVDLVIHVGAPKGLSRLVQRIGRANHQLETPSRALLAPANRFEFLECAAAAAAVAEGELDGKPERTGALDVLAQHILGTAVAGPFDADQLYAEIIGAAPYRAMAREQFDQVLDYVATGGYALRQYERYRRLHQGRDGLYRLAHNRFARQYRMNVGTIVEAPMLRVRLKGGRELGQIEEVFVEQLSPGNTFVFAGEVLRFEGLQETTVIVTRAAHADPSVPSFYGGKFPLSTFLARRVRRLLAEPARQRPLPAQIRAWLRQQKRLSVLPGVEQLLVEQFPRNDRQYLVCYPFEGRLAHQTLGMLMTRRMERLGYQPLGFVASEYALAVWSLKPVETLEPLFDEDMLGDDLEAWLQESSLMKRTFRNVAVIAGLIERRMPGQEKTGRQVTFNADLIYNVLKQYDPQHVLLQATYADAAQGLLDIRRLGDMLARVKGKLVRRQLSAVSPLAVPLMLEIGKEPVYGEATEALLSEAADELIEEATRLL